MKIIFVEHAGNEKPYLFSCSDDVNCGDFVIVQTFNGESFGVAVSSPIEIKKHDLMTVIKAVGAYSPIKPVLLSMPPETYRRFRMHDNEINTIMNDIPF